jgi:hypothetical protein
LTGNIGAPDRLLTQGWTFADNPVVCMPCDVGLSIASLMAIRTPNREAALIVPSPFSSRLVAAAVITTVAVAVTRLDSRKGCA